ncbi:MAG: GNAT family N-acetyltransferase [Lachnospiraceae bacterium]|nr:GNAT family N-acetyltransferase [Lachnospiraceae bacterium]
MSNVTVRKMTYEDIPLICKAEHDESDSNAMYLKNHMVNQENKKCAAFIALYDDRIAGHVFLYYECRWGGLKNRGLPSAVDLAVYEPYRRKGIATALMDAAEDEARNFRSKIYLDVCMNSDYGPAQRFYVKRGYVPDGAGVYYEGEVLGLNAPCRNDDELSLCLVKELR